MRQLANVLHELYKLLKNKNTNIKNKHHETI